jgi:hypothetical protein
VGRRAKPPAAYRLAALLFELGLFVLAITSQKIEL